LGHGKSPVQRNQHGAEPGAGIEQHQIIRSVQAEDRDAIAAADAEFALQRACRLFDARTEARVTQNPALEYDRGLVRRERRVALDQTAKVHSYSSDSPVSYSASRPMRSRQSSAVHGSISEPQRLSRYMRSRGSDFSIDCPPQVRIARRQMSLAFSMMVNCAA